MHSYNPSHRDLSAYTTHLRILGIGGSLRPQSLSYRALTHVLDLLQLRGASTTLFDLRERPLPFCTGDKHERYPSFPAVGELREAVRHAHALVLATPEYHGGLSGVIKNVLDLLDFEHLEGKVIGGLSVLGGPANSNALNDLRRVARWCHAWMIPEQIAIGRARQVFADGEMNDDDLHLRCRQFADSLILNTIRLNDYFVTTPEGFTAFTSVEAMGTPQPVGKAATE